MQRAMQGACDGQHFFDRLTDLVPLLAHMDSDGDIAVLQRGEGFDQLLRGIEALRRVAKPERDGARSLGECLLQAAVQDAQILRRCLPIAAQIGAERAAADHHADTQRELCMSERSEVRTHGVRGNFRGDAVRDGSKVVQNLLPMRIAEGREGESACAV